MALILIAFNFIAGAAKKRVDLTKEKAYTLISGTKAILAKLDTPVKVRFYCTQTESSTPDTIYLKAYAKRVEDLLSEYKQAAHGKVTIEKYDPQPDSDAEDSAPPWMGSKGRRCPWRSVLHGLAIILNVDESRPSLFSIRTRRSA